MTNPVGKVINWDMSYWPKAGDRVWMQSAPRGSPAARSAWGPGTVIRENDLGYIGEDGTRYFWFCHPDEATDDPDYVIGQHVTWLRPVAEFKCRIQSTRGAAMRRFALWLRCRLYGHDEPVLMMDGSYLCSCGKRWTASEWSER